MKFFADKLVQHPDKLCSGKEGSCAAHLHEHPEDCAHDLIGCTPAHPALTAGFHKPIHRCCMHPHIADQTW